MTSKISGNDPKLDQLLDSLSQDTPEITREELLALVSSADLRNDGWFMRHARKYLKIVAFMSIFSVIVLIASYYAISDSIHVEKALSSKYMVGESENLPLTPLTDASVVDRLSSRVAPIPRLTMKPSSRSHPETDSIIRETFIHPIHTADLEVVVLRPDQFAALGVVPATDDEYIYYHKDNKIGFPRQDYVKGYWDEGITDPLSAALGNKPYIAEYATDASGNMMMHYVQKGLSSYSIKFYDRDITNLEEIGEFDLDEVSSFIVPPDRINDRRSLSFTARKGIVKFDTILVGRYGDSVVLEETMEKLIQRTAAMDSLTKVRYGGAVEITKHFGIDLSDTLDVLSKRVLDRFARISSNGKSELAILESKASAVRSMLDKEPSIEGKLRLEQLAIRLKYEEYVAQNKKVASEIQSVEQLIPVLIRPAKGRKVNPRFDDGLILWYRNSDTLRQVLGLSKSPAITPTEPGVKMSVMPNPAMLYLYVDYSVEEATPLRVTLADITGKSVFTDAWKASAGSGKKEINVQQIPNGIYILILDSEKGRTTRQVIIQHQ